jgi:PilZ domain
MGINKRQTDRVRFERGYSATIAALDGTWQRRCLVDDVSQTGAKLMVMGSIEGLDVNEFFLVLSPTGPIRRRCQMAWVDGDTIGVRFIHAKPADEAADRRKRRLTPSEPRG